MLNISVPSQKIGRQADSAQIVDAKFVFCSQTADALVGGGVMFAAPPKFMNL